MEPQASVPSPRHEIGSAARLLRHPQVGLALALLAGLALRLWLWGEIPRTGWISDEGEYFSAASWLAQGRGFTWYQHYLWTRAPLYPLFVAAHLRLFGDALAPIYLSQNALSLLNVALVHTLARGLARTGQSTDSTDSTDFAARPARRIPTLAALLMAVYFPFAIYPQALLSETLFITLLLGSFLALTRETGDRRQETGDRRRETGDGRRETGDRRPQTADRRPQTADTRLRVVFTRFVPYRWLIVAGGLLGLATLTRSLTLLFLPVVAIWLAVDHFHHRGTEDTEVRKSKPPLCSRYLCGSGLLVFLLAAGLTIAPWTLYNSRLYGGLVVIDTSGAFNLMLGGRTAYDGNNRLDAPTRNFVRALVDQYLTRAQREQLLAPIAGADGTLLSDGPCLTRAGDPAFAQAIDRPDATSLPQAQAQGLMTAEGLCLIRARPIAFATKSLGELADLFQINYSGDERFTDNFTTGRLPRWYALGLFLLDDTLYVLTLPLAVLGWALLRRETGDRRREAGDERQETGDRRQETGDRRPETIGRRPEAGDRRQETGDWRRETGGGRRETGDGRPETGDRRRETGDGRPETGDRRREAPDGRAAIVLLVGLWLLYNLAVAPLLFAINRFRLPLLPFAFMLAAYALTVLPAGWRALSARARLGWGGLALALVLLAATPYAYLLPLNERGASPWASYLGPFPSSLDDTLRALAARPAFERSERLRAALQAGNLARARELLASGPLTPDAGRLVPALLESLAGRPADGLAQLDQSAIVAGRDVKAAVVRADLLRSSGELQVARRLFSEQFVDNANPIEFAWDWLRPAPASEIDIAGNLDLGYVGGCYLGEGDPQAGGNFRWCGDGARLRFPQAGTGASQTLRLRADGRGWAGYAATPPPVQVYLGDQLVGSFTPAREAPSEHSVTLPASPPGTDLVITLRTPTFVPEAARYLSQQGTQAGQLQRLGVRLDWARLEAAP